MPTRGLLSTIPDEDSRGRLLSAPHPAGFAVVLGWFAAVRVEAHSVLQALTPAQGKVIIVSSEATTYDARENTRKLECTFRMRRKAVGRDQRDLPLRFLPKMYERPSPRSRCTHTGRLRTGPNPRGPSPGHRRTRPRLTQAWLRPPEP